MFFVWLGVFILLVVAGYWLLQKRSSSKTSSKTDDDIKESSDPITELLKLNLDIRKSGIDKNITAQCEEVIDQLVDLIPSVNAVALPGSELVWTVNRIATEYLPNKCVKPYLALNESQREEAATQEQMKSNLAALHQELQSVAELLAKKDQKEFDAKAAFLKHRFSNN